MFSYLFSYLFICNTIVWKYFVVKKIFVGNGTYENLLHEQFLTLIMELIINKVCNEALFIHAHVTLEYFNFERENRFKRFAVSIASEITAAERLL